MNTFIFAINIKATLKDGTKITDAKGFVENNKRIYKNKEGNILTGSTKIKTFDFVSFVVTPEILNFIMSLEYE